jgi:hypothetical protein
MAAVGTASVAALVYPIFLLVAAAAMTTIVLTAPAPERPGELTDTVVDLAPCSSFLISGRPRPPRRARAA